MQGRFNFRRKNFGRRGIPPIFAIIIAVLILMLASRIFQGVSPEVFKPPPQALSIIIPQNIHDDEKKTFNLKLHAIDLFSKDTVKRISAPENALLSQIAVSSPMCVPVSGKLTSPYGYRTHPTNGMIDFHTGIDISAAEGMGISAVLPAVVAEVGTDIIYGKYIVLGHSADLQTRYCHCSEILCREGETVRQGEYVARVGSTGTVTGPHLHFEVYAHGKLADPICVLEGESIDGD